MADHQPASISTKPLRDWLVANIVFVTIFQVLVGAVTLALSWSRTRAKPDLRLTEVSYVIPVPAGPWHENPLTQTTLTKLTIHNRGGDAAPNANFHFSGCEHPEVEVSPEGLQNTVVNHRPGSLRYTMSLDR